VGVSRQQDHGMQCVISNVTDNPAREVRNVRL
jgi:transcriptional/translational regulatory protein YebC/TACO1